MVGSNPLKEIEKGIEEAESVCDAEIVVAFAEKSGPYRDIPVIAGIAGAFAALIVIFFAPRAFNPYYLIPDVLAAFFICYFIASKSHTIIKLFTSAGRRLNQVRANGELLWYREGVSLTQRRTGILVYVSLLEREGVLLCDAGINKQMPQAVIGELEAALRNVAQQDKPVESFMNFLKQLAEAVAKYVPEAEDNPDELPNTPIWLKGDELWP